MIPGLCLQRRGSSIKLLSTCVGPAIIPDSGQLTIFTAQTYSDAKPSQISAKAQRLLVVFKTKVLMDSYLKDINTLFYGVFFLFKSFLCSLYIAVVHLF